MSRLTSLDKIAMIRSGMGDPSTGDVEDTEIGQYLWLAEMELAAEHDFHELRDSEDLATVASTAHVEMTTTRSEVLIFREPAHDLDNNNFPLDMVDDEWFREQGALLSEGQPLFFYPDGLGSNGRPQIRFCPTPSGVYNVRIFFTKVPTQPDVEDGNISDLPIAFDLSAVRLAIQLGLAMSGERDEADKERKLSLIGTLNARRTLPETVVSPRPWGTFADLIRRR